MHQEFQRLMQDATRLVRAGDLHAATAAIQAALQGDASAAPAAPTRHDDMVIDVEAREVGAPRLPRAMSDDARATRDDLRPTPDEAHATPDEPTAAARAARAADTFISGRFADARSERAYKLYVP